MEHTYMKIHVSSMLAKGVIKNQQTNTTNTTNKQPQWLRKEQSAILAWKNNNEPRQLWKITISHHRLEHKQPHKLKKEYSMPSHEKREQRVKDPWRLGNSPPPIQYPVILYMEHNHQDINPLQMSKWISVWLPLKSVDVTNY